MAKSPKARLRAAVKKRTEANQERDDAIVDMRREGALLNEIAETAGMSIEGVRKALHRRGEQ